MLTEPLTASRFSALETLIAAYSYHPYRHYRILSKRRQRELLSLELRQALEAESSSVYVAARDRDSPVRSACVFRELPWESEIFGLSMARLDCLLGTDVDPDALRLLVDAVIDAARGAGVDHLAARVDIADWETIHALEDHGFRLMDSLVTYIYRHNEPTPRDVRNMGLLRPYAPRDRAQVLEIAAESYADFRGRFHNDPHLSKERATAMYVEWARRCVDGDWAEEVFVTENGRGYLHGFATFRRIEPVSRVGRVEVHGGGLGGCRSDRPGAYMGLLQAAAKWIHARGAVTETQTQSFNFPTIRLYEALGQRFVRAEHGFHLWLGDGRV